MAFKLPNTAVRSPDAAWIRKERWQALTEKEQEQFPPLCPDFVIEIKSPSDSLPSLKIKMQEWMDNGCRLAWLINPETGITFIYHNQEITEVEFNQNLTGEDVLEGFSIALSTIFE